MARSKQRGNKGENWVNQSTGLAEPFPSCPTRQPKYAVYVSYPHDAPPGAKRLIVMNFCATYAALHFVNAALQDGSFKWKKANKVLGVLIPDTIIGENGVEIRCPQGMEEIIEYEMSRAEEQWELPPYYVNQCDLVRREYRDDSPAIDPETGEKPVKPKREPKPKKEKVDKSGLVTIGEIAEQMEIEARDARAALRKSKLEKPPVGWAWPEDKVDEIKKLVKKHLK